MTTAFIQLSLDNGTSVHVNINHIVQFSPKDKKEKGCNITISNHIVGVQQSYSEIVTKLQSLESKTA